MRFLRMLNENGERWLMLWLYAFVVNVIFLEVIRRFVFDYSSLWGEEAARYAFIYLVWIGAAVGIKTRTHIRIDLLLELLPPRGALALYVFGDLATILFACFALYWSIDPVVLSFDYGSVTEALRVTKAWFLLSVPIGFALVILRAGEALVRDIADLRAGRPAFSGNKLFD